VGRHCPATEEELSSRIARVFDGADIGTVTLAEVHRKLASSAGITADQASAIMESFWRVYLGTPNAELIEWARTLRPRYKTGILSNSGAGAREREQAAYGYEDLVDDLVYSHEVGLLKPDPRIYLLSCERLGAQPREVVFLDDREPFTRAARAACMHAVLFTGDNAAAIAEISALLGELHVLVEGTSTQLQETADDSATDQEAQRRQQHPDARPWRLAGPEWPADGRCRPVGA
jgi:putative hydrolase of the HAD superfamily